MPLNKVDNINIVLADLFTKVIKNVLRNVKTIIVEKRLRGIKIIVMIRVLYTFTLQLLCKDSVKLQKMPR